MNTGGTRRRVQIILVTTGTLALLAVSCKSVSQWGDPPTDEQTVTTERPAGDQVTRGGRLTVAIPAETNGWNPFIDQWSDSGTLVGSAFIEALAVQANDGTPQPWLAERWTPNGDHTQWDITLRPNVVFHDNTPMDAKAVKRSLDESYQSGLYSVALGPLYDHVDVTGPLTVRVFLRQRWAQYPTSLANQWILAPAMLNRTDKGVLDPLGTGPFRFMSWTPGESLTASRFEQYWRRDARGAQLPYLNQIQFRPILGDATRERDLQSGQIDVALSTASNIAIHLEHDFNVMKDYSGQRTFLMLNTAVGEGNEGNPFTDRHARRALAHATDRRRIADKVGRGVQTTSFGFRPDSPWAPQGADGYPAYDPALARAEIEKYKQATGASRLSFTLSGMLEVEVAKLMQELKAMWQEVGINVTIDGVETSKLTILAALGKYQAAWFRLHDFPDPDQMLFYLTKANVNRVGDLSLNFTHYTSTTLEENLRLQRESTDHDVRKRASDAIIRETNENVINLWLYDTPASLISHKSVRGLDGFVTHGFSNNLPKPWLSEAWREH